MTRKQLTVYAALAANAAIAVIKVVAAALSGSAALFSEGLHSVVDTSDSLLLLFGMSRSKRPPDSDHPYGHGADVYFWSAIVAISMLGMGGGVSIYEGITHLVHPHPLDDAALAFGTLGAAFAFEGTSWLVAMRGIRSGHRGRKRRGVWESIERGKDPTTFVVVIEDTAALIGLAIAALGLGLAHGLHEPRYDAAASVVIGLLLVASGTVLGRETWSLLLGESASREVRESIRAIALAQPGVRDARPPRTMHVGPDHILVDLDLVMEPSASAVDVVRRIEAAVRAAHAQVQRVSVRFPESSSTTGA